MRRRPLLAAWMPAWFAPPAAVARSPAPNGLATAAPAPLGRAATADAAPRAMTDAAGDADPPALGVSHRALRFPADHGAHPDTHVEWWYVTGWLRAASSADAPGALPGVGEPPGFGFQVTFFRTRTDLAATSPSRFAARQLVIAHVALTELAGGATRGAGALLHDQRAARAVFGLARTPGVAGEQVVSLGDWRLARAASKDGGDAGAATALAIEVRSERFALTLSLAGTQPPLLQGEAGWSQKGPRPQEASHYYSEPQLAVRGRVERAGAPSREVVGRAWLDHEWSDQYLPPEANGWDWVGFNLTDGGALMAFRLRRPDGSTLWAGGTFRDAGGATRHFGPREVVFRPLRQWTSPRTQASYPVEMALETPAGRFRVVALQDDQELDSRGSTGSIYWEGVAALRREQGPDAGWGYLELTGYGDRLKL